MLIFYREWELDRIKSVGPFWNRLPNNSILYYASRTDRVSIFWDQQYPESLTLGQRLLLRCFKFTLWLSTVSNHLQLEFPLSGCPSYALCLDLSSILRRSPNANFPTLFWYLDRPLFVVSTLYLLFRKESPSSTTPKLFFSQLFKSGFKAAHLCGVHSGQFILGLKILISFLLHLSNLWLSLQPTNPFRNTATDIIATAPAKGNSEHFL